MDIGSITATVTGLKTAGEVINSILELKTSDAINAAVREANSHLFTVQQEALTAQSEQFAMVEEIRNLKEKITNLEAWNAEKDRYQLEKLWEAGVVAYALKEHMSNGEPPHYLCTNCYKDGMKSILNPQKRKNGRLMLVCPTPKCNAEFHSMYSRNLPIKYAKNV